MMRARIALCFLLLLFAAQPSLHPQNPPKIELRPSPFEEIILATANVQPIGTERSPLLDDAVKVFNQVLYDDLQFAGYFTMAGKGFIPPKPIVNPDTDIDYKAWDEIPFKVSFTTVGTLSINGNKLRADLSVYDMKQKQRFFRKAYTGDINQTRAIVHSWADEIVSQLTAGASRGIASTQIAYVSKKGKAVKDIYIMDYDGFNPRVFMSNKSLNLFPSWAPDNSKLAFVSYRPNPEIALYSYIDGSRLPFPVFNTLASTPAISPDGKEIAFCMRAERGESDIFISNIDGSKRRNLTKSSAFNTSPAWSPSGRQIAYISGIPGQIFIMDVDGTNVRRIIKEGGDADSISWSPDGKWLAFHWKTHRSSHYDIFVADVATGSIRQVTNGGGSNESPSWAPDGRHIVFQSNRSGTWQIYGMLVGGTGIARQITSAGDNTSPAWSAYVRRNAEN